VPTVVAADGSLTDTPAPFRESALLRLEADKQ
jgi:hypothetical protein